MELCSQTDGDVKKARVTELSKISTAVILQTALQCFHFERTSRFVVLQTDYFTSVKSMFNLIFFFIYKFKSKREANHAYRTVIVTETMDVDYLFMIIIEFIFVVIRHSATSKKIK